ncbi:MAG: hypothetical protein H0Z33_05065 [Bacillaceae bacterium]|nr:hypothetical protein [Bacillaceae bacterium]
MNIHTLRERLDDVLHSVMLDERHVDAKCEHHWEKRIIGDHLTGYYCSRCGKVTLP